MFPPVDQFLKIGDDLDFNCTMTLNTDPNTTVFNVYDIRIKHGNVTLQSPTDIIYHESENAVQVKLRNVSLQDDGMYLCYYGNDSLIYAMASISVGGKCFVCVL